MLTPLVTETVPAGAKPMGSLIAGHFESGQSLQDTVTMQPGSCYTVVGLALPPVKELELTFTPSTVTRGAQPTAAKDAETGTIATLGKRPNCFKWALPSPGQMLLTVTVAHGSGVAAAQLYEQR